jgi:5-methylcytosine-specific restriction endonuclease McrA
VPEKKISQIEFVRSYFLQRPMVIISHTQAKADLEAAYLTVMGKRLEDSDRAIRRLHGDGFLEKVAKGQYMYNPETSGKKEFDEFTQAEKNEILKRDGYKCVVCGLGRENGLDLHIDHIKPRSLGGQGTIENGQVLCAPHNFIKKNLNQTEAGKKGFIRLLELVRSTPDDPVASQLENFLLDVLGVYENHGIDGHIPWDGNSTQKE